MGQEEVFAAFVEGVSQFTADTRLRGVTAMSRQSAGMPDALCLLLLRGVATVIQLTEGLDLGGPHLDWGALCSGAGEGDALVTRAV